MRKTSVVRAGRTVIAALLFLSMWMVPVLAHPTQAVQLVVPSSAGSTLDIVARVLATKLSVRWGQSVVVENRPGIAGTASVAKAPNDGHTLMMGSNGLAAIPFLNSKLSFDPMRDFSGVAQVAGGPMVMLIDPKLPQKALREFIDYAKQHGDLEFCFERLRQRALHSGSLVQRGGRREHRARAL